MTKLGRFFRLLGVELLGLLLVVFNVLVEDELLRMVGDIIIW